MISHALRSLLCAILLASSAGWLAGCAMTDPLATDELQQQLQNPQASVVIVRFVASRERKSGFFGLSYDGDWLFAASNEATGWNLRQLDRFHMLFHTRLDSLESDSANHDSGWITFLVPAGPTYLAAADPDSLKETAFKRAGSAGLDFIELPRFVIDVEHPGSFIYGGTLVAASDCNDMQTNPICSKGLAIRDETALAEAFVARYKRWFKLDAPLQTHLLAVPANHTIVVPQLPVPLH